MKLLIPKAIIFFIILKFNANDFFEILIDLNFLIYKTLSTKFKIWLITVAIAAPWTPILNLKINIGSKMIFKTAPAIIVVIEYFGLPSDLIIEFKVVATIANGKPIDIIPP